MPCQRGRAGVDHFIVVHHNVIRARRRQLRFDFVLLQSRSQVSTVHPVGRNGASHAGSAMAQMVCRKCRSDRASGRELLQFEQAMWNSRAKGPVRPAEKNHGEHYPK